MWLFQELEKPVKHINWAIPSLYCYDIKLECVDINGGDYYCMLEFINLNAFQHIL